MSGLECIPLKAYCDMVGESAEKVKKRVSSKEWRVGTQVIKVPGCTDWWVDLTEVNRWARQYSVPLTDKELGINWASLDRIEPRRVRKKK